MGLDITAVSRVFRKGERPDLVRLAELGIADIQKVAEIQDPGKWDHAEAGEYWSSPDSVELEHRLGSYGSYHAFRQELFNLFHGQPEFREIFQSNDHSSVFGAEACKKIYRDFENGLSRAEVYFHQAEDERGDFIRIYTRMLEAFRLGADDGIVYFC